MKTMGMRNQPVFVSSTFKDMHAERDYLRDVVLPLLEERLRAHALTVDLIDLRWGIDTQGTLGHGQRENLILKVCFNEIERCHPYMIVLLGDRYGWVPPQGRARRAMDDAGIAIDASGKSVTELEIAIGLMQNNHEQRRTFFYFRNPLPYREMPADKAAEYSDAFGDPDGKRAYENLEILKASIRKQVPADCIRSYSAKWDSEKNRVCGLEEFGNIVAQDLWNALKEDVAKAAADEDSTHPELRVMRQFITEGVKHFAGRSRMLARLKQFALGPAQENNVSVITGAAGSGKSALMAALLNELGREDCLILGGAAFADEKDNQMENILYRWILQLGEFLNRRPQVGDWDSPQQKAKQFEEFLTEAAERKRVVCVLDALDQLERTLIARFLTWIPDPWPENARLIATVQEGEETKALRGKSGVSLEALPPLSKNEAQEIIQKRCAYKTLDRKTLKTILGKKTDKRGGAFENPLWLTMAVQYLLGLDADDFESLGKYKGSDSKKLASLIKDTMHEFPPVPDAAYPYVIRHAYAHFGEAYTTAVLKLLALSHSGLREKDLRQLLPKLATDGGTALEFAAFRRYFSTHFVVNSASGKWKFAHGMFKTYVLKQLLADEAEADALYTMLAEYYASVQSKNADWQMETVYYTLHAADRRKTAEVFGCEAKNAQDPVIRATAAFVIEHEDQKPNAGVKRLLSLVEIEGMQSNVYNGIFKNIIFHLHDALRDTANLDTQRMLMQGCKDFFNDTGHLIGYVVDLGKVFPAMLLRLGDIHKDMGEETLALEQYMTVLELYERGYKYSQQRRAEEQRLTAQKRFVVRRLPGRREQEDDGRNLMMICGRIGNLYLGQGKLDETETYYLRSFEIAAKNFEVHSMGKASRIITAAEAMYTDDYAVNARRLGDMYFRTKNLQKSREYYEIALNGFCMLQRRAGRRAEDGANYSYVCMQLSRICHELGDAKNEQVYLIQARQAASDAAIAVPDSAKAQLSEAGVYDAEGVSQMQSGDYDKAVATFEKQYRLTRQKYQDNRNNVIYAYNFAKTCEHLGDCQVMKGAGDKALAHYEELQKTLSPFFAKAKDNVDVVTLYITGGTKTAIQYIGQKRLDEAQRKAEPLYEMAKQWYKKMPNHIQVVSTYAIACLTTGQCFIMRKNVTKTLECIRSGIAAFENFGGDTQFNPEHHKTMCLLYYLLSVVLDGTGSDLDELKRSVVKCDTHYRKVRAAGIHTDQQILSIGEWLIGIQMSLRRR